MFSVLLRSVIYLNDGFQRDWSDRTVRSVECSPLPESQAPIWHWITVSWNLARPRHTPVKGTGLHHHQSYQLHNAVHTEHHVAQLPAVHWPFSMSPITDNTRLLSYRCLTHTCINDHKKPRALAPACTQTHTHTRTHAHLTGCHITGHQLHHSNYAPAVLPSL